MSENKEETTTPGQVSAAKKTPKTAKTPENTGRQTIELSGPVTFEDITKTELVLDLDGLTGDDLANAEAEMQLSGVVPVMVDTSKRYMMFVAAKAAGVPVELIRKLKANDATKVTLAVQGFLMG
jgi:hypothetical protein